MYSTSGNLDVIGEAHPGLPSDTRFDVFVRRQRDVKELLIEEAMIAEEAISTVAGVVVRNPFGQRNSSSAFKTRAFDAWKCGAWE
ncbi:hypothetical protein BCON_0077g00250 [Botryotinia convoluta]|uniref:Uncharacterized protein n=1 Tax=Botryotinia convoluta TaxID=54673 RepID=A0A4Z1I4D9_9HELO|nr:hypothetical protein BCON_0077g00250 [Botryotinia convoluta]